MTTRRADDPRDVARQALAEIFGGGQAYAVPGAYDAISARCAQEAGFPVIHATGAGISCSYGYPDLGLITMAEMVERTAQICRAVKVPVVADADTGYGNSTNMLRTVREFEYIGAAAIHIEDQVSPKKCGQLAGKHVEPIGEAVKKVKAAVAARSDPRFAIIARTDARENEGFDEVVERCRAFVSAGADCVFPMALESEAEVVEFGRAVAGPKMITATSGGKTPNIGLERFGALGYVLVVYAMSPVLASSYALRSIMRAIREDGSDESHAHRMMRFGELYDLVGLAEYQAWDSRFTD